MINAIVWCMLTVSVDGELVETAVKGTVKAYQSPNVLFVDFSDYANKQKYTGDWSTLKEVNLDNCIKE